MFSPKLRSAAEDFLIGEFESAGLLTTDLEGPDGEVYGHYHHTTPDALIEAAVVVLGFPDGEEN